MYPNRRPQTSRSPYDSSLGFRSQLFQMSSNVNQNNQSFDNSFKKSFNIFETSLASTGTQLSQSALISQTSYHTLKLYPTLLPVLVIEAISSDVFSSSSLSVKISSSGWAWLVCGRRLFVWKYQQSDTRRSCSCYELQLPPSDLSHKADLVCVLDNTEKSQSVPSTIAVTPEGIIRFWPNIAYEGHSIEATANDLQGQECTSLTDIQPLGCILGTTTSSLVYITVNNIDGQNTIICRTLKVPQGVLAGFGRKMSSLLFGSMPATQTAEAKQLFKVVRSYSSDVSQKGVYIWVLSNISAQKWHIIDEQSDRLIEDIDLERPVKDAFLDKVWNRETTHPNQLKIWVIDIGVKTTHEMLLLVAGLNADVSNQLYYAIITFSDTTAPTDANRSLTSTNISFNTFTVLRNHTVCYSEEDEEQLLSLHLLSANINSQMVYIYDSFKVLCLRFGSDEIDLIDVDSREDCILGAGICDGYPLLFTHKDALLSIIPNKQDISALMDVQSVEEDILQTDDKVMALKRLFVLFSKGDKARSQCLVRQLFPPSASIAHKDRLDETVVSLSTELCDEIPHSDPRWAETGALKPYISETLTASVIITNQIEEKMKNHRLFIEFLKTCNIWEQLTSVTVKGTVVQTQIVLSEHLEKLIAALTLRKLHNEYNDILETAIKRTLHERKVSLQPGLTPQDIFYRQTTRVEELISALIDYESEQIEGNPKTCKDLIQCLLSVTNIFIAIFQEICHFRQTQGFLFEWLCISKCEYCPWTSTTGANGIRTLLLKQFDFLVDFVIESLNSMAIEEDIQLKGTVCQKMVDLSDIILDGFVCQLRSIDDSHRYQAVERNYESCRSKCINPLIKVRQYDRATALAEKYEDFDVLIRVCEEQDDNERLRRYIVDFANKGFAEYLFKWYLKEGKQAKMLAMSASLQTLTTFLEGHESLNWLHLIQLNRFLEASHTLKRLALSEKDFLGRKKTLFSLSKLLAITGGLPAPQYADIDSQLELILYQESLSPEIIAKHNIDIDSMEVFSANKLIELYMSDTNIASTAMSLKKALDLTEFLEDSAQQSTRLLNIWCSAISRDSWEQLDTDNPLEAVRDTVFDQIIELYLIEGDVNDIKLPPFDDIMACVDVDNKDRISFLVKAVYEHLNIK